MEPSWYKVAQLVKNPLAMWETWVRSLGWEDPLEKEMAPIPVFWPQEFHALCSPWGHKESDTTERLSQGTLSLLVFYSLFSSLYSSYVYMHIYINGLP